MREAPNRCWTIRKVTDRSVKTAPVYWQAVELVRTFRQKNLPIWRIGEWSGLESMNREEAERDGEQSVLPPGASGDDYDEHGRYVRSSDYKTFGLALRLEDLFDPHDVAAIRLGGGDNYAIVRCKGNKPGRWSIATAERTDGYPDEWALLRRLGSVNKNQLVDLVEFGAVDFHEVHTHRLLIKIGSPIVSHAHEEPQRRE